MSTRLQSARAALRDVVAEMERSPGTTRQPMRRGRWALVDDHEENGRRYVVAVELVPPFASLEALTVRERQVVAAAAAGETNKEIAYDLGISDSTVRVLVARSVRKLGLERRADLVAMYLRDSVR